MSAGPSVLIVAAEESSSLYAQRLLEHWKTINKNVKAFGVGSLAMEELGFDRLGKSEEMAVVGLVEIISHWSKIKNCYKNIITRCRSEKPDVAILMDYPGFNLRLAKDLKKLGIRVVYYISPQFWAWREGRVKTVQKYVDEVFVLFPFEVEFYKKHEVKATFVGHPLLDELSRIDPNLRFQNREKIGVSKDSILLGLMPGSRHGEIKHCFSTQLEVVEMLLKKYKNLEVQICLAPSLKREDLNLSQVNFPIRLVKKEPFEMIDMCDLLLVTSGTATLMVGLLEKPMVIMYKASPITAWIGKKLVKIPFFGLVNIIVNREIAPERLQEKASVAELVSLLSKLIEEKEYKIQMVAELKQLKTYLGENGATRRVADALEGYLHRC